MMRKRATADPTAGPHCTFYKIWAAGTCCRAEKDCIPASAEQLALPAEQMKEEARQMVLTMVDMERSYLTADVFREIIQQGGDHENELIRTLSGEHLDGKLQVTSWHPWQEGGQEQSALR